MKVLTEAEVQLCVCAVVGQISGPLGVSSSRSPSLGTTTPSTLAPLSRWLQICLLKHKCDFIHLSFQRHCFQDDADQLTVVTDRSQGGGSISNGSLEIMVTHTGFKSLYQISKGLVF